MKDEIGIKRLAQGVISYRHAMSGITLMELIRTFLKNILGFIVYNTNAIITTLPNYLSLFQANLKVPRKFILSKIMVL